MHSNSGLNDAFETKQTFVNNVMHNTGSVNEGNFYSSTNQMYHHINDSVNESQFQINPTPKMIEKVGSINRFKDDEGFPPEGPVVGSNSNSKANLKVNTKSPPGLPLIKPGMNPPSSEHPIRGLNSPSSNFNTYNYDSNQSLLQNHSAAELLSTEIKMIRLRISDYYRDPILEPIFYKLWTLMIEVQFEK